MQKLFIIFSFFVISFSGFAQQNNPVKINWPEKYEPSKSKFYVHNEIEINAKPEIVWACLIDALKWPDWYSGAQNVSFVNQKSPVLNANSVFSWETMGLKFESSVKQFEPGRLLAWESKKKSIQGFHAWLIIPTENGCKVVTDESQNGWLTFFEKIFQGNKLKKLHDEWLTGLKKLAETHNVIK